MKKILFTMVLAITLIISGCSLFGQKNTVDVTTGTGAVDSEVMNTGAQIVATTGNDVVVVQDVKGKYVFEDENCIRYVKLMECLIDKTPDAAKNQTISSFEKVMDLWKGLEVTALPMTCKNTMDMLQNQKDVFAKAGCEIN